MKKKEVGKHFIKALVSLVCVSLVVVAVAGYFIFHNKLIGPVFLGMGVLNLLFMKTMGLKLKFIYPDLTFGFVDNGIMSFAAIIGGSFGGVGGAIIGGVAGNTITDGIGGFFEGYVSERQTALTKFKSERRMLSSSLGKMTGCMFGAGFSLTILLLIGVF
ncbi:hypothetical protein ACFL0X_00550 [Nanoarchaeota archaeon]